MDKFDELVNIIKTLRGPDGCPWDKKQTLYSQKKEIMEETAELIDALDKKDIENIKEELGDVLLHVVFHSVVASEEKLFTIDDVIEGINSKLIRRHPHVFANDKINSAEKVIERWEEIKKEENKDKTKPESVLDKVPSSLPSLIQAEKLQKIAAKYGFDWNNADDIFDKLQEELNELKEAYKENDKKHISEELGDVIFVLSRLANYLGLEADSSLRYANIKFRKRFAYIEKALEKENKSIENTNLQEMEEKWQEAKKQGL